MRPLPLQLAFGYIAAILQMVVVFHTPIGISDTLSMVLQGVALACWAGFFIIHSRQRKSASAAGVQITWPTPAQQKRTRLLVIIILVVGTLSGPLWLPYTGVVLPFRQTVIVSIMSCVFSIIVYLFARRVMRPKT